LLIAVVLFLVDVLVGAVLALIQLSFLDVAGDLILLEVGTLAIVGGLVEFSRSKGAYEFRRVILDSNDEFSVGKHLDASKRAVMFFCAALVLFVLLVTIALIK
jgi:hypothetical protein